MKIEYKIDAFKVVFESQAEMLKLASALTLAAAESKPEDFPGNLSLIGQAWSDSPWIWRKNDSTYSATNDSQRREGRG